MHTSTKATMPKPTLEDLLTQVAASSKDDPAREIERAASDLLKMVKAALDGQTLRGLPNLGTDAAPFYGANLSGLKSIRIDHHRKIPFPAEREDEGDRQLVFTDRADVVWVRAVRRRPLLGNKPWFDFDRSAAFIDGATLQTIVQYLPHWLTEHLNVLTRETTQARTAVGEANKLLSAIEKVLPRKG